MRRINSFLLSIAVASMSMTIASSGQVQGSNEIKAGDTSPNITVTKLLQAPAGAGLEKESLNGNVVVLEFWATWCAPCIAAFPHLNELADKFKGKPVRFVAITDEDGSIVEPFLRRRMMKTWVGLDTDRSTMKAYSVKFLPTTVVIGRDGKVATITNPKGITAKMLDDLLESKPITTAAEKSVVPVATAEKPAAAPELKPLLAVTIRPSQAKSSGWSLNAGSFKGRITLKAAMSLIHDISELRVIGPSTLSDNRYEITASISEGDREDVKQILARAIEASFKLKVHRETREIDVLVLSIPERSQVRLRPATTNVGHWSDDEGVMAASAAPVRALVEGIEAVLKQPVFDQTGLKGNFDWDLLFEPKNPDSIIDAVRKDLGLELRPAKKPIELLIVELK